MEPVVLERAAHGEEAAVGEKKFAAFVRRCGRTVTMAPQKTRAVFMDRVRFVAVYPRKDGFDAGLVLPRLLVNSRIVRHDFYPPRYHVNQVRIVSANDLDAELLGWLREAHSWYGKQGQLTERRGRGSD